MQRWGVTAAGMPRFRCPVCGRSATRRRPDNRARATHKDFVCWLTQSQRQSTLARQRGITARALRARFRPYWTPLLPQSPAMATALILDATHLVKRRCVALIARDPKSSGPMTWAFAERESFDSWWHLLDALRAAGIEPRFVVCDGHSGLLKALRKVWPQALIQRCLIHVMRQARLDLTRHPKTEAGQILLGLVKQLRGLRTRRQRRRWLRAYRQWLCRYDSFLKERTLNPAGPRRWWYTHRKLRAVRSLLSNSLPDLFRFIGHPEIPRTTNHVEGGINSRLKDLFRQHRGLRPHQKITLTAHYLRSRQTPQKPTRDFL